MKNKKYLCLIGALFLIGCSSQKTVSGSSITVAQTTQTESLPEITSAAETTLPESAPEAIELPDQDGLIDAIIDVLIELDATDVKTDVLTPRKEGSDLFVDAFYVLPDGKKIVVNCSYIDLTERWLVYSVTAADNPDILYYFPSGSEFFDIYDLRTDKLIQESKRDLSSVDVAKEFESQMESITAEGDIALESIRDKYLSK